MAVVLSILILAVAFAVCAFLTVERNNRVIGSLMIGLSGTGFLGLGVLLGLTHSIF